MPDIAHISLNVVAANEQFRKTGCINIAHKSDAENYPEEFEERTKEDARNIYDLLRGTLPQRTVEELEKLFNG